MDQSIPPHSWIDEYVEIGFATRESLGRFGWLSAVSDLGITLQYQMRGSEPYELFFPWTAIAFIRPRPEMAPPE